MQFDYFSTPIPTPTPSVVQHHSWIELSANALRHNVEQFKQILGQQTKLAFVVKANAYGHGIQQISSLADTIREIDFLCTFSLSEALAIRTYGVSKAIIVLGYIDQDPAHAIGNNIAFVVDNAQTIQQLAKTAATHCASLPVHLKIDTGLSRFGICGSTVLHFAQTIINSGNLSLQGIFTHLSESQEQDTQFTLRQLDLFDAAIQILHQNNIFPPLVHASNSAAALQQMQRGLYNVARIGLGLYGFLPAAHIAHIVANNHPNFCLKPILTWKTTIIRIKEVPAQSYISYNRTHQVPHASTLAIVPVGYSNGFDINLSNKGYVLVNGHPAPILGRIAMNVTIIDVTHLKNQVQIGDTVTLLGDHEAVRADKYINLLEIKNVRTFFTVLPTQIPRNITE